MFKTKQNVNLYLYKDIGMSKINSNNVKGFRLLTRKVRIDITIIICKSNKVKKVIIFIMELITEVRKSKNWKILIKESYLLDKTLIVQFPFFAKIPKFIHGRNPDGLTWTVSGQLSDSS